MPNHVHVLIEAIPRYLLGDVVHYWKSFTAKEANKLLGRTGKFWMEEYHDRFIRDEEHLARIVEYLEWNPVLVGLVRRPGDRQYSSVAR